VEAPLTPANFRRNYPFAFASIALNVQHTSDTLNVAETCLEKGS